MSDASANPAIDRTSLRIQGPFPRTNGDYICRVLARIAGREGEHEIATFTAPTTDETRAMAALFFEAARRSAGNANG